MFRAGALIVATLVGYVAADNHAGVTANPLPAGFFPEGVAAGEPGMLYIGSLAGFGIVKVEVATGTVTQFVPPAWSGGPTTVVGLTYHDGYLYACAGPAMSSNSLLVYDSDGALVKTHELGALFANDVIVYGHHAYVTDSVVQQYYQVPLALTEGPVVTKTLGGFWDSSEGAFNTNGIEVSPTMKSLLMVNMPSGDLLEVCPMTDTTTKVPLTQNGEPFALTGGDGLARCGNSRLIVNQGNSIVIVNFEVMTSSGGEEQLVGAVERVIQSSLFDTPTTNAPIGDGIYTPNARFGIPDAERTPDVSYDLLKVPLGEISCEYVCPDGCVPLTVQAAMRDMDMDMDMRRRARRRLLFGSFEPKPVEIECPLGCMPPPQD